MRKISVPNPSRTHLPVLIVSTTVLYARAMTSTWRVTHYSVFSFDRYCKKGSSDWYRRVARKIAAIPQHPVANKGPESPYVRIGFLLGLAEIT